ncbi:MAG: hypothetical protein FGM37_06220 [Phycisphaerales bacterium]|nr:hypothetical protein [Phycisphaerales bacterium]
MTRHRIAHGKSAPDASAKYVTTSATSGPAERGRGMASRRAAIAEARRVASTPLAAPNATWSQEITDASSSDASDSPAPMRAVSAAARNAQSVERFLASSSA